MQVARQGDPFLTRLGVAKAIRGTFQSVAGVDDPEAALEWAVNLGWLIVGDDRETLILTTEGELFVWKFWKAYMEGRGRAHAAVDAGGS